MTQTQAKPADCRPVFVESIDAVACRYKLRGVRIADLSRATLLRFVRDKRIPFEGDTKIEIFSALNIYLQRIGWSDDRDLTKLKKVYRK